MTLSKLQRILKKHRLLLLLFFVFVVSLLLRWQMAESISADEAEYKEYVNSQNQDVPEKNYLFKAYGSAGLCLSYVSTESGNSVCLAEVNSDIEQRIRPVFSKGTYTLLFRGLSLAIGVSSEEYSNDCYIQAYTRDDSATQLWKLAKDDTEDAYYIVTTDMAWALTYNLDNRQVILSEFCYAENQKWMLE